MYYKFYKQKNDFTHKKAFFYGINFLDNSINGWLLTCEGKLIKLFWY